MTRQDTPQTNSGWFARPLVKRLALVAASVAILATVVVIRNNWSAESAKAQSLRAAPSRTQAHTPQSTARPTQQAAIKAPAPAQLKIVARVNGEPITREQLGEECLRHYGEEVLESEVNKRLISLECGSRGIQVSREEVAAEIQRMATHFNLSVQQWYKMLKQERGISPVQYASDIVWPTLALRKLAAKQLQVTEAELREAYETQFGPAVKARLIACKSRQKAEEIRAMVMAHPDDFGRLAKEHSKDAPSASDMGWIPPIRRHAGPKEIEQVVFPMKDGQISPVIAVNGQFVILKREEGIEARNVPFQEVAPRLKSMLEERKIRTVAHDVFRELEKKAKVDYVFKDPKRRNSGIAATLNGKTITTAELREACFERHGKEVLEGTINRKLIEQACKKANITITKDDLAEEVRRAAAISVPPLEDGSADIKGWIDLVTEKQGVSYEIYMHDSVWPSVALRKLAGDECKVSEEDIERGFEANYGPQVRCLAIVLTDLRLAQRLWKTAREKRDALLAVRKQQLADGNDSKTADKLFFDTYKDFFGDLAEQYSVEPGSKRLRGQVPPIQKWGGQPALEKEAFTLKAGDLSGIVQVADKYVILFCQGMTKPLNINRASAESLIIEDLREKKLRMAMGKYFQRLQDFATIDNFIAGTTQSPEKIGAAQPVPMRGPSPVRR